MMTKMTGMMLNLTNCSVVCRMKYQNYMWNSRTPFNHNSQRCQCVSGLRLSRFYASRVRTCWDQTCSTSHRGLKAQRTEEGKTRERRQLRNLQRRR